MEKRRGGGEREEIHETSIRFARTHTRAADYYNKSPSALFGRPGARYAFARRSTRCTRVAFLFTFVVHRAPNAGRATVNGQMAMSNQLSFSRSPFFLSSGSAVLGWRESGKAFRLSRMFTIEYESYGSVSIINSGINVSSS